MPSTKNLLSGVVYEILSSARKREIDSLRASHITYRLHPFSLVSAGRALSLFLRRALLLIVAFDFHHFQTLEKKHLTRCTPDLESPTTSSVEHDNANLPQDRRTDSAITTVDDVETGIVRGTDPPLQDENDNVEYTHVMIPLPGHNFDCVDVSSCDEAEEEPNGKEEKKSRVRLFGGKDKLKDVKEYPIFATEKEETTKVKGGIRSCSIFCAICLAEYEPTERVSWSSNPDCTHVFHEDCVVSWLVSLGRTKSKQVRFSEEPTEAQLLNYQLECPCCRQAFILSKEQRRLPNL